MRAYSRLVITLVGLAMIASCERKQSPPPAKLPTSSLTITQVPPSEVEVTTTASSESGESPPPPVEPALPEPNPAPPETKVAPAPKAPAERIAILTPGGPLLVDVTVSIDGRPHGEAFGALVDDILKAGDTDGDGRQTWKEFLANRDYLAAEMPNAPAAGSRQMKSLIERYDENRDGRIQEREAASWLGRNAGTGARAFALRSVRSYASVPRASYQLWPLVDGDKNGRLSNDEVQSASQKLWSLDEDDDRIIRPTELVSLREQLEAAAGQRRVADRQEASHYAAIHLDSTFEVDRLQYLLTDLYAPRQDLSPASFPQLPGLFKQLDVNADDWLDQEELAGFLTVEPHLGLSIAYEKSEPASGRASSVAKIEVQKQSPEVATVAYVSANRAVFSLGATRLIVSAHDLRPPADTEENGDANAESTAKLVGSQVRMMVHDQSDALFEDLDANADGKLGEREIATCPDRLLESDANGDGQLAVDELPYSMIVAFLLGEQPNERSFYVPPSSSTPKSGVELPAWYSHADLNGDGDISRREFVGSVEQFTKLDANGDGYIGADEAATFGAN